MVRTAAGVGFTSTGEMKESMPSSNEMSDSFFMSIPILGKAAKLTGERKYCEMAARHMDFMQKLDLRPDSALAYFGKRRVGTGKCIPCAGPDPHSLGLPEGPSRLQSHSARIPEAHYGACAFPGRRWVVARSGDELASYAEFTATAMIGVAMLRGVRNGWLDRKTYRLELTEHGWANVSPVNTKHNRTATAQKRARSFCRTPNLEAVEAWANRLWKCPAPGASMQP